MCAGQKEFDNRGARVALITTSNAENTEEFCRETSIPFMCIADPERKTYMAFDLKRGGVRELLGPWNFTRGARAILRGHFQGETDGDPRQMPGAFIFDRDGVLRYAHYAREASDNPPNSDLLEALDAL